MSLIEPPESQQRLPGDPVGIGFGEPVDPRRLGSW